MLEHLQSSKERKKVKHTAKRSIQGKQESRQNNLPLEAFTTFRYLVHSVPKVKNFFINAWKGRTHKSIVYARKTSQGHLLTSSRETTDSWASRETSASLDFFDRLVLRVTGIFLTEALVVLGACTAGSISCAEGSSAIVAWVEGPAIVSLCGSSSSLKEETCYIQPKRKRASTVQSQNPQNTYDARRSKNLTSSSRTGALLVAVLCREVLEEANSLTHFLFLSAPVSSESAGGGDVVELVSSSDSSASSLS
jgi:hypothetical protein